MSKSTLNQSTLPWRLLAEQVDPTLEDVKNDNTFLLWWRFMNSRLISFMMDWKTMKCPIPDFAFRCHVLNL